MRVLCSYQARYPCFVMKRSLESSNVEEAPSGKEKARSGECAVCFETQEMDTRRISQDCRHDRDICEQCTRRHLERNMTIGGPDELVCPSLGCTAVVELDQVSVRTSAETFTKYDVMLTHRLLERMTIFGGALTPNVATGFAALIPQTLLSSRAKCVERKHV